MPQGRADLAQGLRMKGIDPAAPIFTGTYSFDAREAVELARRFPPFPQPPQQQMPQQ
jgi:hypothetical protein